MQIKEADVAIIVPESKMISIRDDKQWYMYRYYSLYHNNGEFEFTGKLLAKGKMNEKRD